MARLGSRAKRGRTAPGNEAGVVFSAAVAVATPELTHAALAEKGCHSSRVHRRITGSTSRLKYCGPCNTRLWATTRSSAVQSAALVPVFVFLS